MLLLLDHFATEQSCILIYIWLDYLAGYFSTFATLSCSPNKKTACERGHVGIDHVHVPDQ